jgi:glutamine synthetase
VPTADAIWKDMQDRGVEFVFAQFVDMYARPSAKLVPVGSRDAFLFCPLAYLPEPTGF